MEIKIGSEYAKTFAALLREGGFEKEATQLENRSRFGNNDFIIFSLNKITPAFSDLISKFADETGDRSVRIQANLIKNILQESGGLKNKNLDSFMGALNLFVRTDRIDGWLYEKSTGGNFVPWLVTGIEKITPREGNPYVQLSLCTNGIRFSNKEARSELVTKKVRFEKSDVAGSSVLEILGEEGFFHETEELKSEYIKAEALFQAYRGQFGKQFRGTGQAFLLNRWGSTEGADVDGDKLVNDEELVGRSERMNDSCEFWEDEVEDGLCDIPTRHTLFMFHLGIHENILVHVNNMKPYEYDTSLREKIVLPENQRDLIDVLTDDIDVVLEDVVEGKSGGTTILCKGAPGLGKTLTAEVYSEVIQRPLYRVHSGQLGLQADEVEENLNTILRRASRWGCALLIDEADVFVRRRDNDIHHNAVVATFLRSLEYFDGLLFMTTNRSEDIDDAILSRCVAIINYELPDQSSATRIWRILSDQFEANLSDEMIHALTQRFKTASGRDIKELLKLTLKFARKKGIPLDMSAFNRCAIFKGVS